MIEAGSVPRTFGPAWRGGGIEINTADDEATGMGRRAGVVVVGALSLTDGWLKGGDQLP